MVRAPLPPGYTKDLERSQALWRDGWLHIAVVARYRYFFPLIFGGYTVVTPELPERSAPLPGKPEPRLALPPDAPGAYTQRAR